LARSWHLQFYVLIHLSLILQDPQLAMFTFWNPTFQLREINGENRAAGMLPPVDPLSKSNLIRCCMNLVSHPCVRSSVPGINSHYLDFIVIRNVLLCFHLYCIKNIPPTKYVSIRSLMSWLILQFTELSLSLAVSSQKFNS